MTVKFIKETASTSQDVTPKSGERVSTSPSPEHGAVFARSGPLLAGLVLWAALTATGTVGVLPVVNYTGRKRHEVAAESGTADVECDPELVEQIRRLFEQGASEFFQDGMHSAFSQALLAILAKHGRAALQGMAEYLFSGNTKSDVVSEALRWLGDFDDPATLPHRWAILQQTLQDRSPRVRDGAILGLAALDDPRAQPVLLNAQRIEPIAELRRLIDQVVRQLRAKHATASSRGSTESLV